MDLPDLPPGTEGYEDSVVQPAPKGEDCTKAEKEFQEHLNSLKIKLEDGSARPMVERRGRDVAGKWIYLCFPCAAVCSGESVLQTHISGKKHKAKLALKNIWPTSIFDDHPYEKSAKGESSDKPPTKEVLEKMAESVKTHAVENDELEKKYGKYRHLDCYIQKELDQVKSPIIGLEYLVEFLPEEDHHEPTYLCVLCNKNGAPRTIVNHLVSFGHRAHYLSRHFQKAYVKLNPYRTNPQYREGVSNAVTRLSQRIQTAHGRRRPLQMDRFDYNREKELITKWVFKGFHFSESHGQTFEEIVDADLIVKLSDETKLIDRDELKKRDPSPPRVPAPRPNERGRRPIDDRRREYRPHPRNRSRSRSPDRREYRQRSPGGYKGRNFNPNYNPYKKDNRPFGSEARYGKQPEEPKRNEHKEELLRERCLATKSAAEKMLSYHEKNPEKHPMYPDEWKKFWNRRYKELQAERKDPTKYDFKPEWIVFWTKRMKELHMEELKTDIFEIYRNLNIPPPEDVLKSPSRATRSPPPKRRSPPRHKSPLHRARSPPRRRSRSPVQKRRSPDVREIVRHREQPQYRASPHEIEMKRRRSPPRREYVPRSPLHERLSSDKDSISPMRRERGSPARRGAIEVRNPSPPTSRKPILEGVEKISDDELKMNDSLSDWGSESGSSLPSLPEVRPELKRERSVASIRSSNTGRGSSKFDIKPTEQDAGDLVSSLRLLVALEDHLGSIGPKIVDLLTNALKLEKEAPNSSENILDDEMKMALIETAKEKLKGALQAGLVRGSAAQAARAAVMRAAALTHLADTRARNRPAKSILKTSSIAAQDAGSAGRPDRAAIAEQIAAALVAQGKTDVSTEELEELVDAVVGMAEDKRKESTQKIITPSSNVVAGLARNSTTTALQLLQNAYEENQKEEKMAATDMDGLSDSDLETLLQNFSELSAEEQNGLIAYLKKLEAKEPKRVERLRAFVGAAVSGANQQKPESPVVPRESSPKIVPEKKPEPAKPAPKRLREESDDEEYSVEDVFKSAAQKIRDEEKASKKIQILENKVIKDGNKQESAAATVSEDQFNAIANILNALQSNQSLLTSMVQHPDPIVNEPPTSNVETIHPSPSIHPSSISAVPVNRMQPTPSIHPSTISAVPVNRMQPTPSIHPSTISAVPVNRLQPTPIMPISSGLSQNDAMDNMQYDNDYNQESYQVNENNWQEENQNFPNEQYGNNWNNNQNEFAQNDTYGQTDNNYYGNDNYANNSYNESAGFGQDNNYDTPPMAVDNYSNDFTENSFNEAPMNSFNEVPMNYNDNSTGSFNDFPRQNFQGNNRGLGNFRGGSNRGNISRGGNQRGGNMRGGVNHGGGPAGGNRGGTVGPRGGNRGGVVGGNRGGGVGGNRGGVGGNRGGVGGNRGGVGGNRGGRGGQRGGRGR